MAVVFDLQQNHPLPKTSVGEAYYSRQLWLYNLGIVIHTGVQNRKNVYLYSWLESETGKGSDQVISALSDFLRQVKKRVRKCDFKTLHLFSDSCARQNKNSFMMAFLLQYLHSRDCLFEEIKFTFPVQGHSFLAADEVFGRIEKEIKQYKFLKTPEDYYKIFKKYGTLRVLNTHWQLHNHKETGKRLLKSNLQALEMQKTRVWVFSKKKRIVGVSTTYTGTPTQVTILKTSVTSLQLRTTKPPILPNSTHVSALKKRDVLKLLESLSLSPVEKQFYDDALANTARNVRDEPTIKILT